MSISWAWASKWSHANLSSVTERMESQENSCSIAALSAPEISPCSETKIRVRRHSALDRAAPALPILAADSPLPELGVIADIFLLRQQPRDCRVSLPSPENILENK